MNYVQLNYNKTLDTVLSNLKKKKFQRQIIFNLNIFSQNICIYACTFIIFNNDSKIFKIKSKINLDRRFD